MEEQAKYGKDWVNTGNEMLDAILSDGIQVKRLGVLVGQPNNTAKWDMQRGANLIKFGFELAMAKVCTNVSLGSNGELTKVEAIPSCVEEDCPGSVELQWESSKGYFGRVGLICKIDKIELRPEGLSSEMAVMVIAAWVINGKPRKGQK